MGTKIQNKKMSNTKNNITIFPESKPLTTQPKIGFLGMGKVDSEKRKDPNQGVSDNIIQNNTVNPCDYADIGDLLTAYKTFFMKNLDEIRDIHFLEEIIFKATKNEQNFFRIMAEEPLKWMLTGMKLALAFTYSDKDLDFILNKITWNKDNIYNIKTMSLLKNDMIKSLLKICNNPMKNLSREKISK